ncbi:hypothetical protein [Methylacidimicrobium sp. B4]|uniref:hypothetical protein n=1 Tax=Methylacidimicrobium sp. B4 TaxID=2796139 RepID=UPI001A8E0A71|nr:hypothetical protein [Methylacidimicrobium sp. B4]QSR84939.1 hypothetical protein MacB4_01300 [Methylacidimicrobium sp. B4]
MKLSTRWSADAASGSGEIGQGAVSRQSESADEIPTLAERVTLAEESPCCAAASRDAGYPAGPTMNARGFSA